MSATQRKVRSREVCHLYSLATILSQLVIICFYLILSRPSNISIFSFKKNNKRTKKPPNRFLHHGAMASIRSLQTSFVIKVFQLQGMDFSVALLFLLNSAGK